VSDEPEEAEVVTGELVPEGDGSPDPKLAAAQVVLDKLRGDAHPSITQMDMIEGILPRELFPEYIEILTEKVEKDPYPSTEMLNRLQRLSRS
jgi:hypothetical protein